MSEGEDEVKAGGSPGLVLETSHNVTFSPSTVTTPNVTASIKKIFSEMSIKPEDLEEEERDNERRKRGMTLDDVSMCSSSIGDTDDEVEQVHLVS